MGLFINIILILLYMCHTKLRISVSFFFILQRISFCLLVLFSRSYFHARSTLFQRGRCYAFKQQSDNGDSDGWLVISLHICLQDGMIGGNVLMCLNERCHKKTSKIISYRRVLSKKTN